jgi:Ca-activated chloride channel family protein
VQVNGRLPPEVITRITRQNFGRFRLCYENGQRSNPNLAGRVAVKFVIDRGGSVSMSADGGSDLPDQSVVSCVVRGFQNLSFPQPEGGIVTVVYPIIFNPGDGNGIAPTAPTPPPRPAVASIRTVTGMIGFVVRLCDPSADLPLEERVVLWRERLAGAGQDTSRVGAIYQDALSRCEAPTWGERTRLLGLMLDQLVSVSSRVQLWRDMFTTTTVADILYRGLLTRVRTTEQLRELHDALGLKRIDPALLASTLAKEKTPADRAAKLRELVKAWPDDIELTLRLLDAYEDADDSAGERALARQLRRRPDANTKVRTEVGEVYLRLAKAKGGEPNDEAEARRTFGEIVEFAPDDPVARRRLGDLLRSHGWYDEAFRQYETLAKLTPDDAGVSLLLADAAAGMGKIEEAVGWAEKAGASAAPDGSELGMVARDWASVYLAWARSEAKTAGRDKEVTALRERAQKLTPGDKAAPAVRVFLTWTHPEVRPALWSNALGSLAPASRGDPLLGIAVVTLPASRKDSVIEVHFGEEDAQRALRLGAEVTLTAIFDEAADDEQITRLPIRLATATQVRRFRVDDATLTEEAAR